MNSSIVLKIKERRGSSAVLLAMIFTGFAICIAGAIVVSRKLVVSSECEVMGRLWTKAILSEYDVHLLEDYSILAYFGNDDEVSEKLNAYLDYSLRNKMDSSVKGVNADLTGLELGDPVNFKKALEQGFGSSVASELISGNSRTKRETNDNDQKADSRVINDSVVLDTLPSHGMGGTVSGETLTEKAK